MPGLFEGFSQGFGDSFDKSMGLAAELRKQREQQAFQKPLQDAQIEAFNKKPEPAPPVEMVDAGLVDPQFKGHPIPLLEAVKLSEKKRADAQAKANDLKPIPTTGVNMMDLSSLPVDLKNLNSLAADLESNKDIVGPWAGRMAKAESFLPTAFQSKDAVRLQELQSRVDNLKQTIGKFKEGGVLRKEDEEKYNKILATVWDNPEVAGTKLRNIHNEMSQKYNAVLKTLGAQGYKTAGLDNIAPAGGPAPTGKKYKILAVE